MIPIEVLYSFFPIREALAFVWVVAALLAVFFVFRIKNRNVFRNGLIAAVAMAFVTPFAWSAYVEWRTVR